MAFAHAWIRLADKEDISKGDKQAPRQKPKAVTKPPRDDDVVARWQKEYPMPQEADDTRAKAASLYHPPRSDWQGIAVALTVICTWALVYYHGVFQIELTGPQRSSWLDIGITFALLEFLYTGLFITTHDAMHGTIAYRHRKLNAFLGHLAITLYAWFDYGMLKRKHWEHHQHTGQPGVDPDFHTGNPGFLPWYFNFMKGYMSLNQLTKISCWATVLHILGAPFENLALYMLGAAVISAVRLFYFGTYLVHKPPNAHEVMSWQKSHSSNGPTWLSFAQCYCFGLHWEHHRWPYAPWWQLPVCRAIRQTFDAHQQAGAEAEEMASCQ
jgi:beta-carotene ketolase (CrtW type)